MNQKCKYCDREDTHIHNESVPELRQREYISCDAVKLNFKQSEFCRKKMKKNNVTSNICDECLGKLLLYLRAY